MAGRSVERDAVRPRGDASDRYLAWDDRIGALLVVRDVVQQAFGLLLETRGAQPEGMILAREALRTSRRQRARAAYQCGIIRETVIPYKIQVIMELLLRLVVALLNLLEHGLEVHRVGYDCKA